MVRLLVKKAEANHFLVDTVTQINIEDLLKVVVPLYNGQLKVNRLCAEIEDLSEHGVTIPPNMQGLTDEQIDELRLKDEWAETCVPSGGAVFKKDEVGRRNGNAPNESMASVLKRTVKEAKDMVSAKKVAANEVLVMEKVTEALDILRGAVMIVYPMGLPPHDPIRLEFENKEDLSGTQAGQEVMECDSASLWWAGKEMVHGKKLMDYVGKNEKTKITCKLQKKGQGAPAREPVVSEEEQKAMMAHYFRKQETMKKLEENEDNSHLDSSWADNNALKLQFHGLSNIQVRPGRKF